MAIATGTYRIGGFHVKVQALSTTTIRLSPAQKAHSAVTPLAADPRLQVARTNGQALGTQYGDPVFAPNGGTFSISNYPSNYPSTGGGLANAHFPYEGIPGQPDYTGTGWTAEVDFVNWYLGTASTPFTGGQHSFWRSVSPTTNDFYYPVVPGLLMGESYHIIPGTTAKSGISLTEDAAAISTYYQVLGKETALTRCQ